MNTKEVYLVYDYITRGLDAVLGDPNPIYKPLFKGKTYREEYAKILEILRVPELLEQNVCDGSVSDPVATHINLLVGNNIPLLDFELQIYKDINPTADLDKVNLSVYSKKYTLTSNIPGMVGETGKKMKYIAKYILGQFRNQTTSIDDFEAEKITGDELVEAITAYLKRNYKIVPSSTNILLRIPRDIMKDDSIIYIPGSINLEEVNPYDYMTNLIVCEYNDPSIGPMDGQVFQSILDIHKKYGNFYSIPSLEVADVLYDLEIYSRLCNTRNIQEYTEGYINFGKPIEYTSGSNSLLLLGNYNETITAFSNNISFTFDKNMMSILETSLKKGILTSDKKVASVKSSDNIKTKLWDMFYINSKPIDGDYNNLTRANVQV